MQKDTLSVLNVINDCSKDGQAVILDREDLLKGILDADKVDLDEIIKELTLTEMIKVKYKDKESFCVVTLPKGSLFAESQKPEKSGLKGIDPTAINVKIDYERIAKSVAKSTFINGFLGAFLAGSILLGILVALLIFVL